MDETVLGAAGQKAVHADLIQPVVRRGVLWFLARNFNGAAAAVLLGEIQHGPAQNQGGQLTEQKHDGQGFRQLVALQLRANSAQITNAFGGLLDGAPGHALLTEAMLAHQLLGQQPGGQIKWPTTQSAAQQRFQLLGHLDKRLHLF